MMFEADPAHRVGERQQEIVMIVMNWAPKSL